MDPDRQWEKIKKMDGDEVRAELERRGLDTKKAVSSVLRMVRDVQRDRQKRRDEQN